LSFVKVHLYQGVRKRVKIVADMMLGGLPMRGGNARTEALFGDVSWRAVGATVS